MSAEPRVEGACGQAQPLCRPGLALSQVKFRKDCPRIQDTVFDLKDEVHADESTDLKCTALCIFSPWHARNQPPAEAAEPPGKPLGSHFLSLMPTGNQCPGF